MINRVLIRIKVVQTLYSYLLVEKKFTLEEPPATPTKEKRYAYQCYINVLALIARISELVERRRGEYPLAKTRFVERILEDDRVRGIIEECRRPGNELGAIAVQLADKVKESAIYKHYLKDCGKETSASEEMLWQDVFRLVIAPDLKVKSYLENIEGFTLRGLERMEQMMEGTLTNFMESQDSLADARNTLAKSLSMSRELYMRLLALTIDLTDLQEKRLDSNRYKYLVTDEDRNPNLKFVENEAIDILRNDPMLQSYVEDKKLSWYAEDPMLLRSLLNNVLESETYRAYMESGDRSLRQDAELWRDLLRRVILDNENFLDALEEKSVFWNDDLDIIGDFAVKTFRRIEEGVSRPVLEQYKDEEDASFGRELLTAVFNNRDRYRELISEAVKGSQWESDRLAFMDVVVVMTALAEILNFPKIPLTVSINEYVEMAKSYSSAKSGSFVHGLLASILGGLREKGQLFK